MQKLINKFLYISLIFASTAHSGQHVHKHVLENGLTILVRPVKTAQRVSTQLWFNVGSKHEADDERGLAHWLEHMCFKGTQVMSETDIRLTAAKLSGAWNATTHYDWTRFYLNFPTQHWFEALPILSDIMSNCTFKQDLLNAEVQVVIQEMKNNRDNFLRELFVQSISAIFPDHPYHSPVIGLRSDLETLSRDKLVAFYKKHYIPNNAVIVVVGNVDPQNVVERVAEQFGNKKPNWSYERKNLSCMEDICTKNIVLYRDIQKPTALVLFRIPGISQSPTIAFDAFTNIIAGGRGSRLYRKLVDQEQLVNSIGIQSVNLFDVDLLLFIVEPREVENMPLILEHIQKELDNIKTNGPELFEVEWAVQKVQSSFYDLMESNHGQAETIAIQYLATQDEDAIFNYIHHDYQTIQQEVKDLVRTHLRPTVMHTGVVLPLPEEEQETWSRLQEQSNKEDKELLATKMRTCPVEGPKYMHTVTAREPNARTTPIPTEFVLSNGLKVLSYHNDNVPKLYVNVNLKFDSWYEPRETPGLCGILHAMLLEGTKTRSKKNLIEELEKHGIGFGAASGSLSISLLKEHVEKGLELVTDIICNPSFDSDNLDKVKQHALSKYERFWDDAGSILDYLINDHFWGDSMPNTIGTPESILAITPEQLKAFHEKYFSPQGATLVIVGDLKNINLQELLENSLGAWQGPEVEDMPLVDPCPDDKKAVTHMLEREQAMLSVAGLSITRLDKDYYPLALFNQVLNKKLFSLREQTSAFYWISGSTSYGASKRPGIAHISTQVSQTRLDEAEQLIMQIIDKIADTFDEHDLIEAQNHIINSLSDQYSTNSAIASTFIFLDEYDLPYDYLATRIAKIKSITVDQVREAVKRVFDTKNMSIFKVGPYYAKAS